MQGAVLNVFNRYFLLQEFEELLANFERGFGVDTSDGMPVMQYVQQVSEVRGLRAAVSKLNAPGNPASAAAAVEFILEGMHLNRKLNKDRKPGRRALPEVAPHVPLTFQGRTISASRHREP